MFSDDSTEHGALVWALQGIGACLSGGGRGSDGGVAPASPIYTKWAGLSVAARLVEHDGLWILVHHLSHVAQHVLLGDDAQETPGHRERERRREESQPGSEVMSGCLKVCKSSKRQEKNIRVFYSAVKSTGK